MPPSHPTNPLILMQVTESITGFYDNLNGYRHTKKNMLTVRNSPNEQVCDYTVLEVLSQEKAALITPLIKRGSSNPLISMSLEMLKEVIMLEY